MAYLCRRLVGALKATSGTVAYGGQNDENALYFSPTIVTDVSGDDKLMTVCIHGYVVVGLVDCLSCQLIVLATHFMEYKTTPLVNVPCGLCCICFMFLCMFFSFFPRIVYE